MGSVISTKMEPWIVFSSIMRGTNEGVMFWGKRVTGIPTDAYVDVL